MILFEDTHLVVINKPAGLLSQSDHSQEKSLVDLLRVHFKRNYVGLIHRLDRNTSGIMVVAKRSKAAERLTEALQNDFIHRSYLAIVSGKFGSSLNEIISYKHYLIKNENTNKVSCYSKKPSDKNAKQAELIATPRVWFEFYKNPHTLVQIKLLTGRSHQIRAQLSFEGYPLLGDPKYGGPLEKKALISRPALHSYELEFPHPMTKETLKFKAPLPADFTELLKSIPSNSDALRML